MAGELQNGLPCAEFEALLADLLDGTLTSIQQQNLKAHRQDCAGCDALYSEAESGLRWLQALKPDAAHGPPERRLSSAELRSNS